MSAQRELHGIEEAFLSLASIFSDESWNRLTLKQLDGLAARASRVDIRFKLIDPALLQALIDAIELLEWLRGLFISIVLLRHCFLDAHLLFVAVFHSFLLFLFFCF